MNSVISYTRKLQLKSLIEDTENASIFMLGCLAEEETVILALCSDVTDFIFLCFQFMTSDIQLLQSNTL